MSNAFCAKCFSIGLVDLRNGVHVCKCVSRNVARSVCRIYWEYGGSQTRSASCLYRSGFEYSKGGVRTYSRKREDYRADVLNCAKRALADLKWLDMFLGHSLGKRKVVDMAAELGMSVETAFHVAYRAEEKFGDAAILKAAGPLWPVWKYYYRG